MSSNALIAQAKRFGADHIIVANQNGMADLGASPLATTGAYQNGAAKGGLGVDLDGGDDYVQWSGGTNVTYADPMSLCYWATVDGPGDIWNDGDVTNGMRLFVGSSGSTAYPAIILNIASTEYESSNRGPAGSLAVGGRYFVVITFSGGTFTIDVDGVSQSLSSVSSATPNSSNLRIGRRGSSDADYVKGLYGPFVIDLSQAWDASERSAMYNASRTHASSGGGGGGG